MSSTESTKTQTPVEDGEWKKVWCRGCGNKPWCTLEVLVKDGVVTKIQGDPENPMSQGKLCSRGNSMIMNYYNPYRVQYPVRRTNPKKGLDEDPGWERISWNEALDIVAEKLKAIRATDPRKFAHVWGFAGFGWTIWDEAFMPAFGSPNLLRTHGCLCPVHFGASMVSGSFLDRADGEYCNYLLSIGGSMGPNVGSAHNMRALSRARDRGMRVVVVDPRCSPEASIADEWVPIRPGTDLAFSLGILHTMLHEIKIFDEVYLKRRSNAVYLIAEDGYYLKDPATGKPLIWDPVDNQAKTFDDPTIKDYALYGTYEVNGYKAPTAFQLVNDHMKQYTPEWAEEITTVPAATIRRLAREYVDAAQIGATITIDGFEFPLRPAGIKCERGSLSHRGGTYQHLVAKMIAELVGAVDVPGGYLATEQGPILSPGPDGVVEPKSEATIKKYKYLSSLDMREFYPHRHTSPFLAWRAMLDPKTYGIDYEPELLISNAANPIMSNVNPQEAIEAIKKIPFVVSIALIYDEMTQFADIVLPESSPIERSLMQMWGDRVVFVADAPMLGTKGVLVNRPAIEKVFDTMQSDEIYLELADRAGFLFGEGGLNDWTNQHEGIEDPYKLDLNTRYSIEEIQDRILKSHFGEDHGLDYFDQGHACYAPQLGAKAYNYYYYPMGTTRQPFYFERLKFSGDELRKAIEAEGRTIPNQDMDEVWKYYQPIPSWMGRPDDAAANEYELVAVNWSTPWHRMGSGDQMGNAWINEHATLTDPYEWRILMNPETAAKRGLKDGDEIVVESWAGGKVKGTLKTTELIHPDAVGFPSNHGHYSKQRNPNMSRRGVHFNALLTGKEGTFDPVSCGIDITPRVKVYKAAEVAV